LENQIVPAQEAKLLAKSPRDIKDLIQSKEFEQAVAAALPKHLKIERFMRVALNAILRQPELRECSKESFFLRMLELSSLGIEPDGRRAHLIPFWNNNFCVCNHTKEQHNGPRCGVPGCGCQKVQSRREVQLIVDYT
jgi:recombination protein RecT